jgi:hypothetical protein
MKRGLQQVLIFLSASCIFAADIQVMIQNPDTAILDIRFNPAPFEGLPSRNQQIFEETASLVILSSTPDISVQTYSIENTSIPDPVEVLQDAALGIPDVEEGFLQQGVSKDYLGLIEGKAVFRLGISSLRQQSGESLQWIKHWHLFISGSDIQILQGEQKAHLLSKLRRNNNNLKKNNTLNNSNEILEETGRERLKIWISEEGYYILPHAMIEDAGFEISGVNPRYLRLYNRKGEIPVRVTGSQDGSFDFSDHIEFFAEPLWDLSKPGEKRRHIYSNENIYWLEVSDRLGLRLGQEDVRLNRNSLSSSRSFLSEEHFEEDNYFNRLPYSADASGADYWLYGSGIAGEQLRRFSFDLSFPDNFSTQLATIRTKLRSQSQNSDYFTAEIYLNDHYVGQTAYSGSQEFIIETDQFSPTYLLESGNQLSVLNKADQEALTYVYLDWFEVTYPRLYEPENDYIRFHPPVNSEGKWIEFRLQGFESKDISLFKINSSRLLGGDIREVTDTLGVTTYTLIFQDTVFNGNMEYLAVTPSAKRLPDSVQCVTFLNLKQPGLGADYIVIVPDDSLGSDALAPLLEQRESQGLRTMVIQLDTLYNEFNSGIPDPLAIQRFLTYAYLNWNPKPAYLLLVGDGFFDNRSDRENGTLIPVPLIQTYKYGAAPSDHFFALLEGDDEFPDIAVGRLPVRNREDLSRVIEKILTYENSPPAPWKNRYLLIGAGSGDDVFRKQSETIIQQVLPNELSPYRLYLSGSLSDPYIGGTSDLMSMLEQGMAMVNFRGHGGGAIWADAGLLDLDDVELIDNNQVLPIITSMTCFTADFAALRTCLGEALVCQGTSGAAAFWGSTGVGWTIADYNMLLELYQLIADRQFNTIGELIRQAKINYRLVNPGEIAKSELYQYQLIGDPAMQLPFPKQMHSIQLTPKALLSGDPITVSGRSDVGDLEVYLEIAQSDLNAVEQTVHQSSNAQWEFTLTTPSLINGPAGVRSLTWNSTSGYFSNGFQSFHIGGVFFDSTQTIPERITRLDSVGFSCIIESVERVDAWCRLFAPQSDSLPMTQVNGSLYRTLQKIGPLPPNQTIRYAILTRNASGVLNSSDTLSTRVQPLPDLAVQSVELSGTDSVYLETVIRNYSLNWDSDNLNYVNENTIQSLVIQYEIATLSWIYRDTLSIPGLPEYTYRIPFYPPMQPFQIRVTVNPDSLIQETSLNNNMKTSLMQSDRFYVSPEIGSMSAEDMNGSVGIQDKIQCLVPPGALSIPSVILIDDLTSLHTTDSELIYEQVYYIDFPAIQTRPKLKKEMQVSITILAPDTAGVSKLYHRQSQDGVWAVIPFETEGNRITFRTKDIGYFSIKSTKDITPPEIDIQIEDQPYTPNCFISRNPSISILLRDESGVDIRPGKVVIELDGRTQNASFFSIPDSLSDQRQVTVTYQPVLSTGAHRLLVIASDIHGNAREPELFQFQVAGVFQIRYLGNYPNPFKRETTFVYILTESAHEASLKIYTVAGRLIRVIDDLSMTSPDYHELTWDGTDDFGQEAANGVYFFRLSAKGLTRTEQVTGKIAKVR